MQKAASGITDGTVNDLAKRAIILRADVLKHSDRDKRVEAAANIPVIVFDEFHAIREASALCSRSRVGQLLLRNVKAFPRTPIALGHGEPKRAPAATRFHYAFSALKLQLAAHEIHFLDLGSFESDGRRLEVGARVDHLGIEP